jgi:glycosyltransferase Alg8
LLLVLYLLALGALALHAPAEIWDPRAHAFLLLVGWIAVWRYSWSLVHLARSLWFRRIVFPRWRRLLTRVQAAGEHTASALLAPEVFIVVTSYRIAAETTLAAFEGAIGEAARYPARVTVVAALVEMADQRLVKRLFTTMAPPASVRLLLVRENGTGKRDALGAALRAISRQAPQPGSLVLLQDGDTVLPPGCLAATAPFFRLLPWVHALTTDEDCLVPQAGALLRAWHQLRFAQRHVLMSSMALSRRLITMTGRMSIYRAEIATDPDFIAAIQHDFLDHWRLGRLKLLTGEDKSAAWWLLARGRRMLYVPDVKVLTIEQPPAPGLIAASTALMLRWFGNMLRASGRCLALGPSRLGWFIWWCLVDQRLSMWTTLVGPIAAALLTLAVDPAFLWGYLLWVMATRLIQSLLLLTARPRLSGLYPPLLYFTQVYGALIKTWILFRLDRQRWTRQGITWAPRLTFRQASLRALASAGLHLLALSALGVAVALAVGVLPLPMLPSLAAVR